MDFHWAALALLVVTLVNHARHCIIEALRSNVPIPDLLYDMFETDPSHGCDAACNALAPAASRCAWVALPLIFLRAYASSHWWGFFPVERHASSFPPSLRNAVRTALVVSSLATPCLVVWERRLHPVPGLLATVAACAMCLKQASFHLVSSGEVTFRGESRPERPPLKPALRFLAYPTLTYQHEFPLVPHVRWRKVALLCVEATLLLALTFSLLFTEIRYHAHRVCRASHTLSLLPAVPKADLSHLGIDLPDPMARAELLGGSCEVPMDAWLRWMVDPTWTELDAAYGISHPYQSPRALSLLPSRPWLANALALLLLRWNITFELYYASLLLHFFCLLLLFYYFFHVYLNLLAEITRFGDRVFYLSWWKATGVTEFWQRWNIPVHTFAKLHVYAPMRRRGYSRMAAMSVVFLLSAFGHELFAALPLGSRRVTAFAGMLSQAPLSYAVEAVVPKRARTTFGRVLTMLALSVTPMAPIAVYAYDYIGDRW